LQKYLIYIPAKGTKTKNLNSQTSILRKPANNFRENIPNNNFLTVRPIFTVNIPINSGQSAEKYGTIIKVSNSR
jgi:hypothetical protein